jgi:hypothetical protein
LIWLDEIKVSAEKELAEKFGSYGSTHECSDLPGLEIIRTICERP